VLHGDRLRFIVADVSGKGVAAALYMAVAKTLFRATVQGDVELPDVLARMNGELCRDNDQMVFVTALAGHLSLLTGEVALADAGHNPAVVTGPDGGLSEPIIPKSIALGVIEDAQFAQSTLVLDRGATLLLYTDGATDARDPNGEIFGTGRLEHAIAALAGQPPGRSSTASSRPRRTTSRCWRCGTSVELDPIGPTPRA
jgi:sigma-B regulation protein RsbU (phosphoserine phosphatase)